MSELPEHCDICKTKLVNLVEFIDGATVLGSWAIMCHPCHHRYGRGLGTGRGQLYRRSNKKNPNAPWVKVI